MLDSSQKPLSEVVSDAYDRTIVVEAGDVFHIAFDVADFDSKSFAATLHDRSSLVMTLLGETDRDITFRRVIDCVGAHASVSLVTAVRVYGSAKIALDSDVRIRSDASFCTLDDRLVVDGFSRAIVRHRIVVDASVRDSDVSSSVRGMRVSDTSSLRAIPELDVCSNAVFAKHAVAIAQPNLESIAYFATRGVEQRRAIQLLSEQFLCPISPV